MQTPTKFALALLAVVAAVAPLTMTANAGHSISMNGVFLAGADCAQSQDIPLFNIRASVSCPVDVSGDALDGCVGVINSVYDTSAGPILKDVVSELQSVNGTFSTCTHIFPDETTQVIVDTINNTTTIVPFTYTIVANGVHIEPARLAYSSALFGVCGAKQAVKTTVDFVNGAPAPGAPPTQDDVNATVNYTKAWAKYQTTTYDHTNLVYNASACPLDGGFTKQAKALQVKACFYDANAVLIECHSGASHYDYKGDLVGSVPAGAASMSVRSALNTFNVAWWWYPGTI